MAESRQIAVLMLQDILENKIFLSEAKNRYLTATNEDTAFINMLLLTTLRHLTGLKKILKTFVKKKLPPQSRFGEYALLLGTAEILYLHTPDYAVINSYVEMTKNKLDKYVAGFVNAVLRKVCAQATALATQAGNEFFPPQFRSLLKKDYTPKAINKIETAAVAEPWLDLTTASDPTEIASATGGRLLPLDGIRLPNGGRITNLPGYEQGRWWVQDFAASLPVKLLAAQCPLAGKEALDLCAAPGGKTAQLLAAGARTTVVDISDSRLNILRQNLARLQLPAPQQIICADALEYLGHLRGDKLFDVILLDAPCSATGTLRRHPELVHIKTEEDVNQLVSLQQKLLTAAAAALKPGGIIIYCVCSLSKAEGEHQIETFLRQTPQFRLSSLAPVLPGDLKELSTPEGYLRILPFMLHKLGGADGFFIAKLVKQEN